MIIELFYECSVPLVSRGDFAKRLGLTAAGRGMVWNPVGIPRKLLILGGIDLSNLASSSGESVSLKMR